MSDIKELDIKVDPDDANPGVEHLLAVIRPDWKWETVDVTKLSYGLLNHMWKVQTDDQSDDVILIRVFKDNSYLDHDAEFQIICALHKVNIIMPMYCRFVNGYAYKYEDGDTLTPQQVTDPHIYRKVIDKFHQLHAIDISYIAEDFFMDGYNKFLQVLKSADTTKLEENSVFKAKFPPAQELLNDFEWALNTIGKELCNEFPLVLCHHDVHMLNVIYNPVKDRVTFIDFDGLGRGPEVYDIAILMERDPQFRFQAAGIDITGDEKFKREWLKCYLETHPQYQDQEITTSLIDKWMDGLSKQCISKSMGSMAGPRFYNRVRLHEVCTSGTQSSRKSESPVHSLADWIPTTRN